MKKSHTSNLPSVRAAYGFSFAVMIITIIFFAISIPLFIMSFIISKDFSTEKNILSSISSFIPACLYFFAFLSLSRLKKRRRIFVTISLVILTCINILINACILSVIGSNFPIAVIAIICILACSACALNILFLVLYIRRLNGGHRAFKLSWLFFIVLLLTQFGNLYYSVYYTIFSQQMPTLPPGFALETYAGMMTGLFTFVSIIMGIFAVLYMAVPQFIIYKASSDDVFYQLFIESKPYFCWNCRAPIMPDSNFCTQCGSLLISSAEANMNAYCTTCGSPLQPGSNFCPKCGNPVAPPVLSQNS